MAIKNKEIPATTNTELYKSVGNNAITTIIICNRDTINAVTITLYAVANAAGVVGTPADENMIIQSLSIPAGDTISFDQEKMVLENNDTIIAYASATGLSSTVSTLPV